LFDQNVRSTVFINAPAGRIFPGDAQWTVGNAPHNSQYLQLQPRVGVVWDPEGKGQMTVRAAYGMFTQRRHLLANVLFTSGPPYGNNITLTNVKLSDPWAIYPGGNPFPFVLTNNTAFPLFGTFVTHPFDRKNPYTQQWNLSLQRQIGTDWLVTANYVGSNTIHYSVGVQLNPAVFLGLDPCTINGVSYPVCSTVPNTNQRRILSLKNADQGKYYSSIAEER